MRSKYQREEGGRNPIYDRLFAPADLDWRRVSILDIGAGPVSIFEHVAPPDADVVAYDTLADDYNALIPDKKFPIVPLLPPRTFNLITLLNCLDHMEDPGELLAHAAQKLEAGGQVWVYCNVDQPYQPELHPQDFRFWHLIALLGRHFDIARCGLVREGPLFPYAWWAVCRGRSTAPGAAIRRPVRQAWHLARCAAHYAHFHGVRALVKGLKLIGLRRLLPKDLQF